MVLLVDDNIDMRIMYANMLHEHEVVEASNGLEALVLLARLPRAPDLIILDIEMPVMDGPTFLARKAQTPWRDIPVLVASTVFDRLVDDPGVDGMFDKRDLGQLWAAVNQILEGAEVTHAGGS